MYQCQSQVDWEASGSLFWESLWSLRHSALVLLPTQKVGEAEVRLTVSALQTESGEGTREQLEEPPAAASTPVMPEVCQSDSVGLEVLDSTPVAVEAVEGVEVRNVESAQSEVTTAAVHREDPMTPLDAPSRESIMPMTPEVTTVTDPVENPSAVDAGSTPHQEYPLARDEGSIPAEGTEIVPEGAPLVLIQTTDDSILTESRGRT